MDSFDEGGPQNLAEARRLLGLAAEQGHAAAQYELGVMHYEGEGGPRNYEEARRLYALAAEQEYAAAQYGLGVMHDDGEGGPQNYEEARRLYALAAEQGDTRAAAALAELDDGYYSEGTTASYTDSEAEDDYRVFRPRGLGATLLSSWERRQLGVEGGSESESDDAAEGEADPGACRSRAPWDPAERSRRLALRIGALASSTDMGDDEVGARLEELRARAAAEELGPGSSPPRPASPPQPLTPAAKTFPDPTLPDRRPTTAVDDAATATPAPRSLARDAAAIAGAAAPPTLRPHEGPSKWVLPPERAPSWGATPPPGWWELGASEWFSLSGRRRKYLIKTAAWDEQRAREEAERLVSERR